MREGEGEKERERENGNGTGTDVYELSLCSLLEGGWEYLKGGQHWSSSSELSSKIVTVIVVASGVWALSQFVACCAESLLSSHSLPLTLSLPLSVFLAVQ